MMKEHIAKGIKRLNRFAACMLVCLLIFGCGAGEENPRKETNEPPLTADTNTIIITQEDGIIGYVNEEFDESLYSFADFEMMVNSEVEDYNSQMGVGGIEIRQCELAEGRILLSLCYQQLEDYEKFNAMTLRCGQTLESVKSEFQIPNDFVFVDAHDPEKTVRLGKLRQEGTYLTVVTDDDSNIRILGCDIQYIGEGDLLVGDCEVQTAEDKELHIIIYASGGQ